MSVVAFLRALVAAQPRRVAVATLLMLALGLTEWVGLLLLVPLLALVGVRADEGAVGQIANVVQRALGRLGVEPSLTGVLLVFIVLVTVRALLQRGDAVATAALEQELVAQLRRRLYAAIVRARWIFLSRQRSSDFVHVLSTEVDRVGTAASQLLRLAGQTLVSVAYVALALSISPMTTALASAAGAVLVLALRRWNARARQSGHQIGESMGELFAAMSEHVGGVKTARVVGAEAANEHIFAGLADRVAGAYVASTRAQATASALFAIGAAVVLGAFVHVAVRVLALQPAAVLLLLLLFSRLVPRFSSALSGYQHFATSVPAYANVMRWIDRCEAAAEPWNPRDVPIAFGDAIRLQGVRFRYLAEGETLAIADLDLDIAAHRTTAIVGPSGAGKSTVADLVLGLLVPDAGVVAVDDVPLAPERARAWRAQIGYVAQDTFLLHDTVRANLLWAAPDATEDDVWAALRQAAADGFVSRLPNRLDTVIGDRGTLLSGGERQRLALARALLRRPALLVLDEATSALDSENERRIQRAIAELHGRMTILVITHRLSTIRGADMIHVMEHGRVVESGDWDTLLADESGRFRALCAAQGHPDTMPVAP